MIYTHKKYVQKLSLDIYNKNDLFCLSTLKKLFFSVFKLRNKNYCKHGMMCYKRNIYEIDFRLFDHNYKINGVKQ